VKKNKKTGRSPSTGICLSQADCPSEKQNVFAACRQASKLEKNKAIKFDGFCKPFCLRFVNSHFNGMIPLK